MNNFVTHLECSEAGDHYNFAEINNLSNNVYESFH